MSNLIAWGVSVASFLLASITFYFMRPAEKKRNDDDDDDNDQENSISTTATDQTSKRKSIESETSLDIACIDDASLGATKSVEIEVEQITKVVDTAEILTVVETNVELPTMEYEDDQLSAPSKSDSASNASDAVKLSRSKTLKRSASKLLKRLTPGRKSAAWKASQQ